MVSKVRVTFTGVGSKKFLKKFFGRKIRDYNVMRISNNHWVVEFLDGDMLTDQLRLHANQFRQYQEKRFFSGKNRNKVVEMHFFNYKIQKIINFDENEIESRFTRINWPY